MDLQREDCLAGRETPDLGQSLHMGRSKGQDLGHGHGMIWGPGMGWRQGLVLGKGEGHDMGWDLVLGRSEDHDMGWAPDLVLGMSEVQGLGLTWGCWRGAGTWNRYPFHWCTPCCLC